MNHNISEVERMAAKIKIQERYIKELESIKGNQFTPMVYAWNLDILDEMKKKYEMYIKEKESSEDNS